MKRLVLVLVCCMSTLGGCAALDAFMASDAGSKAKDDAAGAAVVLSGMLPPPWNIVTSSLVGMATLLLTKKKETE